MPFGTRGYRLRSGMNPLSVEATPLLRDWLETGTGGGDARYEATGRFGPAPRRPFERESIAWSFALSFFGTLSAVLLTAKFSKTVAAWLRGHELLLYVFPYGMSAGVLFGACLLPLPRRLRVPHFGVIEFIGFLLLAALWGVCIGICVFVLGIPNILLLAVPLATVFSLLEWIAAVSFYMEGRRRAESDPLILLPLTATH